MTKTHFLLFADCVLVKGIIRAVIIDLNNSKLRFIPLILAELLEELQTKPVEIVKSEFTEHADGITAYLDKLIKENLGFFTDLPQNFSPLSQVFEHPSKLINAVIDIDESGVYSIIAILEELDQLRCEALAIRVFSPTPITTIQNWLTTVNHSTLRFIELYVPYEKQISTNNWNQLLLTTNRLQKLVVYNSPFSEVTKQSHAVLKNRLFYTRQSISNHEFHNISYLTPNIQAYQESCEFNLGLNRKIAIEVSGAIKNFPGHQQKFGQAGKTPIRTVIENTELKKKWTITKNMIEDCRQCEFRYICPDNDELIQKDGVWHKSVPCTYSPQTGEWKTEG